ncbi:MAG: hypothetical protein ACF8AM_12920 [Rhodopirellula sp. JB055]|uniref:hypothetical protein n=1 Tax=Rhodopirellula sp. JB055 TaxID=3342846 RepID=UPI00370BB680
MSYNLLPEDEFADSDQSLQRKKAEAQTRELSQKQDETVQRWNPQTLDGLCGW